MRYSLTVIAVLFIQTVTDAQQRTYCRDGQCVTEVWNGRQWVAVQPATPIAIPPAAPAVPPMEKVVPEVMENHGIDLNKLKEGQGGYEVNGQKVDRAAAFAAIEGNIPDLTGKRRIIVVGDPNSTKASLALIGTPDWATVQSYTADHWYIQKVGFQPGVTVCDPDGKVVHRQSTNEQLDENLNRVKTIPISSPTPNPMPYNPAVDPDLTPKAPTPVNPLPWKLPFEIPSMSGIAIGGLIVMALQFAWKLWNDRKKQQAEAAAKQAEKDKLLEELLKNVKVPVQPSTPVQ